MLSPVDEIRLLLIVSLGIVKNSTGKPYDVPASVSELYGII